MVGLFPIFCFFTNGALVLMLWLATQWWIGSHTVARDTMVDWFSYCGSRHNGGLVLLLCLATKWWIGFHTVAPEKKWDWFSYFVPRQNCGFCFFHLLSHTKWW